MPDVARWVLAALSSVVLAAIVFVLATVGIVVGFFVFLVLFVVIGLAVRRQAKTGAHFGGNGTRFVFYTNIPGDPSARADAEARYGARRLVEAPTDKPDAPHETSGSDEKIYDLSTDDYTVEPPEKNRSETR